MIQLPKKNIFVMEILSWIVMSFGFSCTSVVPSEFQRYYSPINGSCIEYCTYDGVQKKFSYENSHLMQLLNRFPDAKASSGTKNICSYFYFENDNNSGMGDCTADLAERAAFFLLQMNDSEAKENVYQLQKYLVSDDYKEMQKLLEKLVKQNHVQHDIEYYNSKSFRPKIYQEYIVSEKGDKISHGLTRIYYENGMIQSESFYIMGKKEDNVKQYGINTFPISNQSN